jgi:hypothetical protein
MRTSDLSVCISALGTGGLILLTLAAGSGSASAETFRHGDSMTTIEQSGGGTSRSAVTRNQDAQKIVTQNGNSTDITIQGGSDFPAADDSPGFPEWGDDLFDWQRIEERFARGADAFPESTASGEREAFKMQMLDRMRGRFEP